MVLEERLEVRDTCKLVEVTRARDLVATVCTRDVTDSIVKLLQTGDCNCRVATGVHLTTRRRRNIDRRCIGNGGGGLRVLVKMEGCLLGTEPGEQSGWLDEFDVAMKMLWKAVGRSADEGVAAGMLPNIVFLETRVSARRCFITPVSLMTDRIKHFLGEANWDLHFYPITCGGMSKMLIHQAMTSKPRLDHAHALSMRSNEFVHFLLTQVVSITFVERVAARE